ncbi:5'-adenylylsulfate reductase-like 4 [Phoenix dactylifera]|uniref:5'-adenylylsulfate reductase-like 4 n=1 Tax=Phoenix dactylifera TaxID=42345 RepID=A0A8B7BNI6_PHODC|nr:5'-adenylylsulfate reductase-like 4 [Phoenix dactylifera]
MGTRVWTAGFLLLLGAASLPGGHACGAPPTEGLCPRVSAGDSILGHRNSCTAVDFPAHNEHSSSVIEGGEHALSRALQLIYSMQGASVAVLFYASWCPFSKIFRPSFDVLSSLYPTVRHFAVEESLIGRSILSRYGVRGFPTLFIMNCTYRVQYHGSRRTNSLVAFYSDITGIKPESLDPSSLEVTVGSSSLVEFVEETNRKNCPYSWSRTPEKLLQQNTYLALATFFLLLRLLYFLLSKLNAWWRCTRHASLMSLWDCSQAYFVQAKQVFCRLNPCKRSKGAMNAKSWASKTLASVSIGEPSSARTHFGSEGS